MRYTKLGDVMLNANLFILRQGAVKGSDRHLPVTAPFGLKKGSS